MKKRTLANLSKLPDSTIENLRLVLKGGTAIAPNEMSEAVEIVRSLPHGHVAAVLGTAKKLELPQILAPKSERMRDLVLAMIVARIIEPSSKLATARGLNEQTCLSSLGELLGLEKVDEEDLYEALDWLEERQDEIEQELAKRHLKEGALVLYDITSTYVEGQACPLAAYGYNRDKKKGKKQIVLGLLCDEKGRPIAVEAFEGNTSDSTTLPKQIEKVRSRFGISQVIWVGDRGTILQTRIEENLQPVEGLQWITGLTSSQINALVAVEAVQLGLFDQQDLVEFTHPNYPGERLIACRNPLVAARNQKRTEELLQATEVELDKIVAATTREKRTLVGADKIGLRVGKVINRYKVGKFFDYEITETSFSYRRKTELINQEAALDGVYMLRTSVPAEVLDAPGTVRVYKSLSQVEQAFRSFKGVDLKVRPIYHYLEHRVRGHIFLCLLAYYVEWHLREALAPLLFEDEDLDRAAAQKVSVVAPAEPSPTARDKAKKKRNRENFPVHSFRTLLSDLGTLCHNTVRMTLGGEVFTFRKFTQPTPLQEKAFELLGVSGFCTQ